MFSRKPSLGYRLLFVNAVSMNINVRWVREINCLRLLAPVRGTTLDPIANSRTK